VPDAGAAGADAPRARAAVARALAQALAAPRPAPADPDAARRPERHEELFERLQREPWTFDFAQAVRRVECAASHLPRVGASTGATEDPLRFAQDPFMVFAPCTLPRFEPAGEGGPPRLFVNFMGMLGPHGPLPLHLTDFARTRLRHHRDPTLASFLDVFNHRMVALFYRAWASSRQTVSFDREPHEVAPSGDAPLAAGTEIAGDGAPGEGGSRRSIHGPGGTPGVAPGSRERLRRRMRDDRFSVYVGALFGLGVEGVRQRDALPDLAKLHYAGRLIPSVRNAEGLAAMVADYFGVRTDVEEFAGRWAELPPRYRCTLGGPPSATALGVSTVVGARVWDRQGMFRLRLGPMSLRDYERLLPGGPGHARLTALIRQYLNDEFAWEAVLVLKKEEAPMLRLGSPGLGSPGRGEAGSSMADGGGARLGWTTWLRTGPLAENPDDLALRSPE
jgi:type VI secretion system protein ImpH